MTGLWGMFTLVAALASGIVGGVFYAFSTFVMGALARLPAPEGVRAMQSINIVVINPAFLGVFVGAAVLALVLGGYAAMHLYAPGASLAFAGCVAYFAGTFVVTMACNVPLNNALAAADPSHVDTAMLWAKYVRDWTFWNHVRTGCAVLATLLLSLGWRSAS